MGREVGTPESKAETTKRLVIADAESSTFDSADLAFATFFSFLTKSYFPL